MRNSLLVFCLVLLCVGCAGKTSTPTNDLAASSAHAHSSEAQESRAEPSSGLPAMRVAVPDIGASVVPQPGLGGGPTESASVPPRVARFVEELDKGARAMTTGWISAAEARQYASTTVPALAGALAYERTYAAARQLLLDIGPMGAPYLRQELEREHSGTPLDVRRRNAIERLLREMPR